LENLQRLTIPDAELQAGIAQVPGSHAIYISNPDAVAKLIEQAANGVK